MEQLIHKKYKMLYPSESKLIKYGFKKIKNTEDSMWKHTFPVYKYNKITTIEGTITVILPSGKVLIDIYSNGDIYTPFYNLEYGNYEPIMNIINGNIVNELNKFHIKEKKNKNKLNKIK